MRFNQLRTWLGHLPWFDLPSVMQGTDEAKAQVVNQLSRWCREGKLIPLRRGMYAWTAIDRKAPLSLPALANELYRPSYLTGLWALGFHGLIPEKVARFTSATTRVPRQFRNELGDFHYAHLKSDFFWGYERCEIEATPVLIARPEKALLDHWHWNLGEWTEERIRAMRFQPIEEFNQAQLEEMAARFGLARLRRTATLFSRIMLEEEQGEVVL